MHVQATPPYACFPWHLFSAPDTLLDYFNGILCYVTQGKWRFYKARAIHRANTNSLEHNKVGGNEDIKRSQGIYRNNRPAISLKRNEEGEERKGKAILNEVILDD